MLYRIVAIIALAIVVLVAGTLYVKSVHRAQERVGALTAELEAARLLASVQAIQFDVERAVNRAQRDALTTLRSERDAIQARFDAREAQAADIEKTEAGGSVRSWRAQRVPDGVRRLYESEGCTDAARCY